MAKLKVHKHTRDMITLCGRYFTNEVKTTTNTSEVTCKFCMKVHDESGLMNLFG